ncbi:MAG: HEAT repeat domain-containing protein [Planctomycetota bacterium]|nr:HEAT repeat domain-containing protein [Planctomycetota bacterium]
MSNKQTMYLQYRGQIRALASRNEYLYFVTTHEEDQATALYRLNSTTAKLAAIKLHGGSGKALSITDKELFIANVEDSLERFRFDTEKVEPFGPALGGAVMGLASVAKNRLAVLAGSDLVILSKESGAELQRFDIGEECHSIAVNPDGQWLAVGSNLGTVAIFECENKDDFVKGDAQKLHEGAVKAMIFDREELRLLSTGSDCKLKMTHVRGRLDPEDRGGKSNHEQPAVRLIDGPMAGPEGVFYSGGTDKTFKAWPAGLNKKRPFTMRDGVGVVVDMALVEHKKRPHLVVASNDATLRFWELEDTGRPKERVLICRGAMARAKHELKQKETERRDAVLDLLAKYNDTQSISLLTEQALNDGDYKLRVKSTKLIADLGNLRTMTSLEQLLNSADEGVREEALTGLRSLEGQESIRPLQLAIKTGKKDVGLRAITGLEELSSSNDQALVELTKALEVNTTEIRTAALVSLENVYGSEQLSEAHLTGLRSSKADIRSLSLTWAFQKGLLDEEAIQAALRRHGEDDSADVRHTAFLVSTLSRPSLTKALRERDSDLHRNFVELETHGKNIEEVDLPKAPTEVTVAPGDLDHFDLNPLLQAMASRALDTCLRGATSLALLQDSRAFGTLLQLSREKDDQTRVEVCKALKNLNDPRGIARLRLMIRDGQAGVRDAAFSALIQLESETPLEAAQAGLNADHEDVRRRALQLLIEQIKANPPQSKEELSWRLIERSLNDSFAEVRSEAFKACLNLQFAGGGESTLRFALKSLHRDVRNEVFVEIMAQLNQDWAWPLLLEMLCDPDSSLRKEVFAFATKRAKGRTIELLSASLDCPYNDLRGEATKALNTCKEEGAEALLFRALDDSEESVRQLALSALLNTGSPALSRVMKSKYPDVRARAAHARALEGDEDSMIPLLQLVTEDEPDISDFKAKWQERVELALKGLAELGAPGALDTLEPLLESKIQGIRRGAAKAMAYCSRPDNKTALLAALRHSDAAIKMSAALGLAACADTTGTSVIFGGEGSGGASPDVALRAALALGEKAANNLLSFLDSPQDDIRSRVFMALMLLEASSPGPEGTPERCLAGLSADSPDIRMRSAEALENYSDPKAFGDFVVKLFNDRSDDKPWTVESGVIETLGDVLAHGDSMLRYRAGGLLASLREKKQDRFDRAWGRFSRRFDNEISAARAKKESMSSSATRPGAEETARLVFGTYVGLSRLQDHSSAVQIRQTALRRLFEASEKNSSLNNSVKPVFVLALGDSNNSVRKQAFEYLSKLMPDVASLCTQALSSGQRDVGALGFQKLVDEGDAQSSRQVLERVLKNNVDGLEFEASQILGKQVGLIPALELGFEAKSESLRGDSTRQIAKNYEDNEEAANALRRALKTRYRGVKILAAMELASKQDPAAFDFLKSLLLSDRKREQKNAIKSLKRLGDKRAGALFLDRIDNDPAGTALHAELFSGVGETRSEAVLDRLLQSIKKNKNRNEAFEAAFIITGYDQAVGDDLKDPGWEEKQEPRNGGALAKLMEVTYRISDESKLSRLIPAARWCRSEEVTDILNSLAYFPKEKVRHEVVEALGWRARERNGSTEILEKLLKHDDGVTGFLAAEGLALSGGKEGLSVLQASVELLADVNQRRRAVKALGKLGDEQALDLLLRIINDTGHALQEESAEALGHMSESDQAESVFKTLSRLAEGSYGVALSAMTGLRWFDSMDAWSFIRNRAADNSWMVREHVAKLLAHDKDPEARNILIKRIESDNDSDVIEAAVKSLKKICGEDSLDADYALVCSQHSHMVNKALERLKEKGDSSVLLEILPKVSSNHVNSVVEVLLSRTPLPIAAAAKVLETSTQERTIKIASQILGRGGEEAKEYAGSLVKACSRWQEMWVKERSEISDGDRNLYTKMKALTETYRIMLWSCGRLNAGGEALIAASDPKYFTEIREAALTGLSMGLGGDAGIEALAKAVVDADASIRSLASSGLTKLAPEKAASLVSSVLDDRTSLNRLLSGVDNDDSRIALRSAAATVHHQGVALPHLINRGDIDGLGAALADAKLPEATRLGAIEGLARIASVQAETVIVKMAKDEAEDEDLRKAAWRALRRSKRYRARKEALAKLTSGDKADGSKADA